MAGVEKAKEMGMRQLAVFSSETGKAAEDQTSSNLDINGTKIRFTKEQENTDTV